MMIIKLFRTNFPNNFVNWSLMINFDWKISSIIISSKFGRFYFAFGISTGFLHGWLILLLSLIFRDAVSTCSDASNYKFIDGWGWLGLLMVYLFTLEALLLWEVVFREVSKCWMWVSWSEIIFPWFEVYIFGLKEYSFKSVFYTKSWGNVVNFS
jgi:hypothetical protein